MHRDGQSQAHGDLASESRKDALSDVRPERYSLGNDWQTDDHPSRQYARNTKKYWWQFGITLFIVFLLHLPFVYYAEQFPFDMPHHMARKPIKVHYIAADSLSHNKVQKLASKEIEKKLNGQVVSIAPPKNQKRPDKADYLAEYNSATQEQTQAHKTELHQKLISSKPEVLGNGVARGFAGGGTRHGDTLILGDKAKRSPLVLVGEHGLVRKNVQEKGHHKQLGLPNGGKGINLFPSLEEATGINAAPFADQLNDVEIDAETRLNTWQWKHASFFNRIKERIANEWRPQKQIRLHDPRGTLLGLLDRITVIRASINKEGDLVKVEVERASGVYYLDDEALRAFRAAGPFMNPPNALFDKNSMFTFNFGFHISPERGLAMDLNWQGY